MSLSKTKALNSREVQLIENSLQRAKSDLAWEKSLKKRDRVPGRIERAETRINILKSWLSGDSDGRVKDPSEKIIKHMTKQALKEAKTKEFEDMIKRLDEDPKCGATMELKRTEEVDAIFDLIQKEIRKGRKNLVFVWPQPIVRYYTHKVKYEFKKLKDTTAQRKFATADPGLATADDYDKGLEDDKDAATRESDRIPEDDCGDQTETEGL